MAYDIRDATNDELDFVLHATKMSRRNSDELLPGTEVSLRKTSNSVAFGYLNPLVNGQVERSAVLVAAQGRAILGFIVFEIEGDELVVHFAYVKDKFRRQGVARELLLAAIDAAREFVPPVKFTAPTTRFADVAERYQMEFRR